MRRCPALARGEELLSLVVPLAAWWVSVPCVRRDGITGVAGVSVDGLPNEVHFEVLRAIAAMMQLPCEGGAGEK